MDAAESAALRAIAMEAVQLVGGPLAAAFRSDTAVEYKVDLHDVVTRYDRQAEQAIRDHILSRWSDSAVLGEEHGASGEGRVRWYVDPIDGTSNFARGIAFWCISIGAAVDDEIVAGAILDPVADNLFSADLTGAWLNGEPLRSSAIPEENKATLITGYPVARDFRLDGRDRALDNFATLAETFSTLRRPGSAALSIAHVAAGWADAACGFGVNAWDVTAAILLLRQAGGTYRSLPLGKIPADRPDQFHPGYMAWGNGGNYPTLTRIAEAISVGRTKAA
ncbi:inositol monophosphatase family protein [Ollibium composti]|jgi:myo-inositol-1(or 4)-monophosphatase|uniref:Inositol-1-monophosphatase n=1 Tax=Ollibium composti TaxID=2675109 RepID=A0ABY2Q365_9HYPH|nr:inositol monophosphatase family protein [Mesorhizobium composti]THF54425.1 inositol monophosphatase [Mesorhizobium composti]